MEGNKKALVKLFNAHIFRYMTSIAILFISLQFVGPYAFKAGAFEFDVSFKISLRDVGTTFIHLPPLGNIAAKTHFSPLNFHFTLKNVSLDLMETQAEEFLSTSNLFVSLLNITRIHILKYTSFLLVLSFCLGMLTALLWGRYRSISRKEYFFFGLTNVLVLLFVVLFSLFTYNTKAFSDVEYEGILEAKPFVMEFLDTGQKIISELRNRFYAVILNISVLQQEIEKYPIPGDKKDKFCIMHISDIHNNPATFNLIQLILDAYHVDLIIDTGDLVDFGTALELMLVENFIRSLNIPYIFVPGNHDSPAVVDRLKKINNVVVLEDGVMDIGGMRIAGIADPSSYISVSEVANEETLEEAAKILQKIVHNDGKVDIIAAHNPLLFRFLRGRGHLLLGGHIHVASVSNKDDCIEINAGTSGASGIRGLEKMKMQYSLVLIHFIYNEGERRWHPQAADLITVNQFPTHFGFERFLLTKDF